MKNNWQTKKLGEVTDFTRGLTYSKNDEVDTGGTIVLRANNINLQNNTLDFSELKHVRENLEIPNDKRVHEGSLIITTASGSQTHLGKVALIDKNYNYAFGGFMGQLSPIKELDSKYLFYVLTSDKYRDYILSFSKGMNINNLKFDQIKNFGFPMPELVEQKRIVKILDEVFVKIEKAKENTEKNLQNSKELFDFYLESVFTDKNNWILNTLGSVFDFKNGRSFKKSEWSNSGLPIIRIQNLNNEISDFNYYKGSYSKDIEINQGDLLFSWSGTVGSSFGPHIWNKHKGLLNQHIFKIQFKKEIDLNYAFYYLKFITSKIERNVNGAVGLVHITKAKLNNFEIPLPKLNEQKEIVKKLDDISEYTQKLEEVYKIKLEDLDELKKSILNEAFWGRL